MGSIWDDLSCSVIRSSICTAKYFCSDFNEMGLLSNRYSDTTPALKPPPPTEEMLAQDRNSQVVDYGHGRSRNYDKNGKLLALVIVKPLFQQLHEDTFSCLCSRRHDFGKHCYKKINWIKSNFSFHHNIFSTLYKKYFHL